MQATLAEKTNGYHIDDLRQEKKPFKARVQPQDSWWHAMTSKVHFS